MALSVFSLLLAAMLSSAGWLWVSNKVGKYKAWVIYNAVNALTNILFLWPAEGDPANTIFVMGLNGIPVGGQFLINSITSDVVCSPSPLSPGSCALWRSQPDAPGGALFDAHPFTPFARALS